MSTSTKGDSPRGDAKSEANDSNSSNAGRIVHDSRGNAVWKWGDNGSSTATTSKMLRKLDLGNLSVEGAAQPEAQAAEASAPKKKGSGYGPGYNPYDRTAPVRETPAKKPSR